MKKLLTVVFSLVAFIGFSITSANAKTLKCQTVISAKADEVKMLKDFGNDVTALTNGSIGIMQGFKSFMLQSDDGSATLDTKSLASGINFYSCGPEHSYLKSIGRVNYTYATDEEAFDAFQLLCKSEGILPAFEPSFAILIQLELLLIQKLKP